MRWGSPVQPEGPRFKFLLNFFTSQGAGLTLAHADLKVAGIVTGFCTFAELWALKEDSTSWASSNAVQVRKKNEKMRKHGRSLSSS